MTPFKAVAWDVDGTLVDSEPLHHRALLAASRSWGVDLSDLPDQHFRGVHMGDVWKLLRPRLPPALPESEWQAAIVAHYVARRRELVPLPGARETVVAFAARGLTQVCVSNSSRAIVEANLDALGVRPHIAFCVTLDDVQCGKPDPEPYRLAAQKLALPPDEILAVEDSQTGAASALAAGLRTALFPPLVVHHERATPLTRLSDLLGWPELNSPPLGGRSDA